MRGRRGGWGRGRKHKEAAASRDAWRRNEDTPVSTEAWKPRDDFKDWPDCAGSRWDSPTSDNHDWYGLPDIPSVASWDDSAAIENLQLVQERHGLPCCPCDCDQDLYSNSKDIDWNSTTSHTEIEAKAFRPHSPVILGLSEINKEVVATPWEAWIPDSQIQPSGWGVAPAAQGQATGWDVVEPFAPNCTDTRADPSAWKREPENGWEVCPPDVQLHPTGRETTPTHVARTGWDDDMVQSNRPNGTDMRVASPWRRERETEWETEAQVQPTVWEMNPSQAEQTGWVDNVVQSNVTETRVDSSARKLEKDSSGWETIPIAPQKQVPIWPQAPVAHMEWDSSAGLKSADHTSWSHNAKEAGVPVAWTLPTIPTGPAPGWANYEPPSAAWVEQPSQPVASGWTDENQGGHYGWDDYPCYTNQVSQISLSTERNAAQQLPVVCGATADNPSYQAQRCSYGHWKGQAENLHQASYTHVPEPLQVRRQAQKPARHYANGYGGKGYIGVPNAKQWATKQPWNPSPNLRLY